MPAFSPTRSARTYQTAFRGFIILFSVFFGIVPLLCAPPLYFCFYSAETSINNFKSLKMEFDQYLAGKGAFIFQPFSERETFERFIKKRTDCLLLLSSRHFQTLQSELDLQPLLTGTADGQVIQRRILVGKGKTASLNGPERGRVASAGSVEHTRAILALLAPETGFADSVRILRVPKDIDALMSVGFGMSRWAVATSRSLDRLKAVNPVLYKELKILAEGAPTRLLIVAAPRGGPVSKPAAVLMGMNNDPAAKRALKMLNLDGFRPYEPLP
jgi:hypothetical protein